MLDRKQRDLFIRWQVPPRVVLQHALFDGDYEKTKTFLKKLRPHVDTISLARRNTAYRLTAKAAKDNNIVQARKCPVGDDVAELIGICCFCCLPQDLDGSHEFVTKQELQTVFAELHEENRQKERYTLFFDEDGSAASLMWLIVDTDRAQARTIVTKAYSVVQKRIESQSAHIRHTFRELVFRDKRFEVLVLTKSEGKQRAILREHEKHALQHQIWNYVRFTVRIEQTYASLCPPQFG